MKSDELSFDGVSLVYVRCLRVLGLLPFEGPDSHFLDGSRILVCYFLCSTAAVCGMIIGHLIAIKTLTVDGMFEATMTLGQTARFYLIARRRASLRRMIAECRAIWSECCDESGHRTVLAFERKARRLMFLLVGNNVGTLLIYTLVTLVQNARAESNALPFKWYIADPQEHWPGYWVTFLVQQTLVYSYGIAIVASDITSPLLIMLASGYFRHLADQLYTHDRRHGADSCSHYRQFVGYVKFHQRLLRLCAQLEEFCRMVFLVQVLTSGYNLSLIGIKLLGSDPDRVKYAPVMVISFLQLLMCQWAPDKLYDESSEIAKAAYCSSLRWIADARVGKLVVMVIAKAQQPAQMTAGGLFNLSLERFGSMMTSALSFFMVLRNFNL